MLYRVMKKVGVGYLERNVRVHLGESISDFLTVEMYIKISALEKKNQRKLFFHAIAWFCWFYFERELFMSLFLQSWSLSCL